MLPLPGTRLPRVLSLLLIMLSPTPIFAALWQLNSVLLLRYLGM
jgi:hypothetical protein